MTQEGRNQKRKIPGNGLNIQSYILTSPDLKEKKRNFDGSRFSSDLCIRDASLGGAGGGGGRGWDGGEGRRTHTNIEQERVSNHASLARHTNVLPHIIQIFPFMHLRRAIQMFPLVHLLCAIQIMCDKSERICKCVFLLSKQI